MTSTKFMKSMEKGMTKQSNKARTNVSKNIDAMVRKAMKG